MILLFVDWAAKVHAVPADDTIGLFFGAAGDWLLQAMVVWILYVSQRCERGGPIRTWDRLLTGKWLDAQVGSHVLIGAATVGRMVNGSQRSA